MPSLDREHTGSRIADHRKLAHLSRPALAARACVSLSLLEKVERGNRPATPDLTAAVARALRIDVTALTGQPYTAELHQDRFAELIRPIREALDLYDLGDDPDLAPRPAAVLIAEADDMCRLVRATRLREVARRLPALTAEITAACYRTPGSELWAALASVYRSSHDIAVKLGFTDLSTVALDRMGWAADRASDPLTAAVRQYMRALIYFRAGEQSIGLRLIGRGHVLLGAADPGPDALAVAGQLHLGEAVLHARHRSAAEAKAHLAEAEALAARTGEAGVLWLSFGPTNVALHRASTLIEMRRYGEAAEQGARIRFPADWSVSRRAHHHVHQASALMETGRHEAALGELLTARRIAPEQTRYYSAARETITALVHHGRRAPDTLSHLAAWVGVD